METNSTIFSACWHTVFHGWMFELNAVGVTGRRTADAGRPIRPEAEPRPADPKLRATRLTRNKGSRDDVGVSWPVHSGADQHAVRRPPGDGYRAGGSAL